MAPRCTGRWGALATRDPSGPNIAHEKSRRSLIFTLMLVRCKVRPICSAMPMNLQHRGPHQLAAGAALTCWGRAGASAGAEMQLCMPLICLDLKCCLVAAVPAVAQACHATGADL